MGSITRRNSTLGESWRTPRWILNGMRIQGLRMRLTVMPTRKLYLEYMVELYSARDKT